MGFTLERSVEVLERTPGTLRSLLGGLSSDWYTKNEGAETFSPFDVLGHLIHGEKTDWIVRLNMILSGDERPFPRYDRFAQLTESQGKSMQDLLDEFEALRRRNLLVLREKRISGQDLELKGTHPVLGTVNLRNLLATWVAHDLAHLAQIARVMAKQYKDEVGPWIEFISLLKK